MDIFQGLLALLGTTPFDPLTNPHPYPLIRAGGLFILIMGLGISIGSLREWLILPMIGVGFGVGFLVLSQVQGPLLREMGTITNLQSTTLIFGYIFEGVGIGLWCAALLPREGPSRRFILGILVIVGLHFIFFFLSMGWLMILLTLACTGWALYALRRNTISISRAYLMDGLLKIAAGLAMVIFYPV
jgi:hypothetical protein